jgi:branched-chain amino acid aminotransferase
MVYLGSEAMGLRAKGLSVNLCIAAWPWPDYVDAEARDKGIRVRTSSFTRHHVNVTMCKAKSNGNYINSILALHEALDCGCDEALLLDPEGYVAEGTGENVFLVKDGVLHTPELTSCLNGITRNTILHLAAELDIEVRERRITRDEVYIADEAFFTGTAAEVLPIRELDGRRIGSGARGPVTERLQSLYFDQVRGQRNAFPEWHDAVDEA